MNTFTKRGFGAAAGILVLAASLVACSTPAAETPETSAPDEIVKADIVVAAGPTLSNTNVYIGQSQGIFEDHGLTATNAVITAGPDAIPQLLSGAWTFAMVDTTTAISAAKEGVPVVAVATATVGVPDKEGYAAIMTGPDSGITSVTDLEGRKMQINALGGTAEALVRATMTEAGGDPDKIQFVEVPPQGAIPALQAGQVDAAFMPEPLLTAALGLGFVDIGNPEENTIPDLPSFVFLASKDFVAKNAAVVAEFQDAILEANKMANSDHDLVLETAKTSTTVDPALLANVKRFPLYGEEPLTADQVDDFIAFLEKYDVIDKDGAPTGADVVLAG
jgi:NitT/TauT family transport system substrate-binding protein